MDFQPAGMQLMRRCLPHKDRVRTPRAIRKSLHSHPHSLSRTSSVQSIPENRTADGCLATAPPQTEVICRRREGYSTDCILSHCWTIFNRPLDYQRCPRCPAVVDCTYSAMQVNMHMVIAMYVYKFAIV